MVFAGSEGGGNGAGVPRIFYGLQAIDSRRKQGALFGGRDFKIRKEQDEVQLSGDGKHLPFEAAHDIEAAVTCRGGVVRMAFQLRAQFENFATLQRTVGEVVQTMEDAETNRRAAAETTRR